MNTCETCKHWDQKYQLEDLARFDLLKAQGSWVVQHRSRESALREAEWGDCDTLHHELQGQEYLDSTYVPPLQTHKDFGCTLHEPRP